MKSRSVLLSIAQIGSYLVFSYHGKSLFIVSAE